VCVWLCAAAVTPARSNGVMGPVSFTPVSLGCFSKSWKSFPIPAVAVLVAPGRKGPGQRGEQWSSLSQSRCSNLYHVGLSRHQVHITSHFYKGVFTSPCAFPLGQRDNSNTEGEQGPGDPSVDPSGGFRKTIALRMLRPGVRMLAGQDERQGWPSPPGPPAAGSCAGKGRLRRCWAGFPVSR